MKANILLFIFVLLSLSALSQETGGPYTTDENTVLLMHFDGDANNSSGIGNNGVTHGSGVSYETGVHGQALRLNNSTADKQSWIEVPFYDELNVSSDGISVECWFKLNSWGENGDGTLSLFRKDGSYGAADYEIILWPKVNEGRHGQVNMDCEDEETRNWGADAPIADILELNTWYYIVIYYSPYFKHEYVTEEGEQRQASSIYCLIRDENFEEIFASRGHTETPPTNSDGLFRIGFGGWVNSYFDGWIDELRISNVYRKYRDDVLKDVDISAFKDSIFIPIDEWLSYGWPFGEFYPIDPETGEVARKNSCGPMMLSRGIHFWEHPRFPSGEIEHNFQGLSWYANYNETEYLWDQIYDFYNSDATEEYYAPAATFTAQVGVASRKTYDNMYCMPKFLKENFHYSEKTRVVFEEEYTKEEWENIIRNELNNGRICMVGGWGHYYIINGYNSKNQFFTDYSMSDYYWNDIKDFDYGDMQDMIIYFEPDWQGKTLSLDYPKGSEYIQKQTQKEIKWTSSNINTVLLEYSTDAGKKWQTIAENVDASTGKYLWTIPETISEEYKVRVSDTSDGNIYRRCNTFNVFDKQEITFNYPQNNTYFQSGTKQPVYWNSEGIKAFKLEYSTGESWKTLCDSITSAENLQSFTMPNLTHNSVQLKATNLANDSVFFKSESFRIMEEGLVGGVYKNDENTMLLMHFEEAVSNEANNTVIPEERSVEYKIYDENYDLHLGKAFRVNNTNDAEWHCLRIGHTEELDLGNNWTIETWVKYNEIGTEKTEYPLILEKGESFGIWLDGNGNGFGGYARFNDQSEAGFFQNQKLEKGKWYHVAITGNANKRKVSFYVHNEHRKLIFEDSRDFPSGNDGTLNHSENDLFIGGVDGGSNIQFDGWIDELRIIEKSIDYSEMVTNIAQTQIPLRFTCCPNPLNQQSFATFHLNNNEKVDLSIFDLNGRKICTILNRKLNAGTHKVPLSNSLPASGIYFCKLQTSEGISTLKLINR